MKVLEKLQVELVSDILIFRYNLLLLSFKIRVSNILFDKQKQHYRVTVNIINH